MIYKFRIVSDEVENFKREIEIDADSSFLDLRNAILDSVGYDKGQMSSFFMCEDGWEKGREITLEDMGSDSSEDVYLMDESILSDFMEDEGQRLIFVFDYLTDRSFFMELKRTTPGSIWMPPYAPHRWARRLQRVWILTILMPKSMPRLPPQRHRTLTRISTAQRNSMKMSLMPRGMMNSTLIDGQAFSY